MNEETLIWEAYENSKSVFSWLDSGGLNHLKTISQGKPLNEETALDLYLSDFFKSLESVSSGKPEYDPNNPPEFNESDYDQYLQEIGGFNVGYQEFINLLQSIRKYPSLNKFRKYLQPSQNVPEMSLLEYLLQDALISQKSSDFENEI